MGEAYFLGVETDEQQRIRFQVELEFVQCFANPNYLHCMFLTYMFIQTLSLHILFTIVLAQRGYFKDPAFVNYIKYLQYWKEPAYAKYLK